MIRVQSIQTTNTQRSPDRSSPHHEQQGPTGVRPAGPCRFKSMSKTTEFRRERPGRLNRSRTRGLPRRWIRHPSPSSHQINQAKEQDDTREYQAPGLIADFREYDPDQDERRDDHHHGA